MNEVATAMKTLKKHLKKCKDPGSYYYSWQSNLAMTIYDGCENKLSAEKCNEIAVNFIEKLIK